MKVNIETQIPVIMMKEGDTFVCYSPAFDLASHGDTFEDAENAFRSALKLFCRSVTQKGTWEKVLKEYGWQKIEKRWAPPVVIKQESFPIKIHATV